MVRVLILFIALFAFSGCASGPCCEAQAVDGPAPADTTPVVLESPPPPPSGDAAPTFYIYVYVPEDATVADSPLVMKAFPANLIPPLVAIGRCDEWPQLVKVRDANGTEAWVAQADASGEIAAAPQACAWGGL